MEFNLVCPRVFPILAQVIRVEPGIGHEHARIYIDTVPYIEMITGISLADIPVTSARV